MIDPGVVLPAGASGAEKSASENATARDRFVEALPSDVVNALGHSWHWWARAGQVPPPGEWRTWLILAGRGFGKTRAGAEWVRQRAEDDGRLRIALVASTMAEARAVRRACVMEGNDRRGSDRARSGCAGRG